MSRLKHSHNLFRLWFTLLLKDGSGKGIGKTGERRPLRSPSVSHFTWKINFLYALLSPASFHTRQPSVTPYFHKFQIRKPLSFGAPFCPATGFWPYLIPSTLFSQLLTPQFTGLTRFSHRSIHLQSEFSSEPDTASLVMNLTHGKHPINVCGRTVAPRSPPLSTPILVFKEHIRPHPIWRLALVPLNCIITSFNPQILCCNTLFRIYSRDLLITDESVWKV